MNRHKLRALIILTLPVIFGFGPCGPIAGGKLSEPVVTEKVTDFRFVQDADRCAVEVSSDKPHSVTVNCWAVGNQLYIGCRDCEEKKWSRVIDSNPLVRVRIAESIYPVKATRLLDPVAIERAWNFRLEKYVEDEAVPVPEGYWLFHMGSRPRG
ncbi:MAG: hypothetical protein ACI9W1_003484 [Candidatus Azotimanducaceae bacterium]|jgi:hypothetical protein